MNALSLNLPKKHFTFTIQTLVTAVFVLYLFYIDEGYFDLRWMKSLQNWFWFAIYILVFSVGQMIAKVYLFKKEYNLLKSIVIGITGVMIDVIIIMLFVLVKHIFE